MSMLGSTAGSFSETLHLEGIAEVDKKALKDEKMLCLIFLKPA